MNLYEITEAYLALDNLEPNEEIKEYLDAIEEEFDGKIENIIHVIKNNEVDIDGLKKEEKRLADKRRILENKNKFLTDYAYENMKVLKKDKLKAGTFDLKIQKNPPSVKIIDDQLIGDNYIKIKKDIDKAKIKQALKDGLEIEGAELVQTEGLRIK